MEYDVELKVQFFKTREKAEEFKKTVKSGSLYYYSPESPTKNNYIFSLERKEKYFDEEFAEQFPYCVDFVEIIEK